jgi:hypothetical protein
MLKKMKKKTLVIGATLILLGIGLVILNSTARHALITGLVVIEFIYRIISPLLFILVLVSFPFALFSAVYYAIGKKRFWNEARLHRAKLNAIDTCIWFVSSISLLSIRLIGFEGSSTAPVSHIAPDGAFLVRTQAIEKRPANEFIDPCVYFRATLIDAPSGKEIATKRVEVFEQSDVEEPKVSWQPDSVVISGYDSGNLTRSITLRKPSSR